MEITEEIRNITFTFDDKQLRKIIFRGTEESGVLNEIASIDPISDPETETSYSFEGNRFIGFKVRTGVNDS